MSTHITLRMGDSFHIYRDCNDPDFIYIADINGNELKFPTAQAREIGLIPNPLLEEAKRLGPMKGAYIPLPGACKK